MDTKPIYADPDIDPATLDPAQRMLREYGVTDWLPEAAEILALPGGITVQVFVEGPDGVPLLHDDGSYEPVTRRKFYPPPGEDRVTLRPRYTASAKLRDLHAPYWIEQVCDQPRKGCGRADCTLRVSTMWGANQYVHEYGHQLCSHCTSGGDPYTAVSDEYPCPTLRALEGDAS